MADKNLIGPRNWNAAHVFNRRRWAFFLGGLVAAPALGLAIAGLVTYMVPREYLGRVRLQIYPYSQDYEVFRDSLPSPSFIKTQLQIISSAETLYNVIDELQLVKKWEDAKTPVDAYGMLVDKLETQEAEGTDLIDVKIYHTNPHEAADLGNAIARAYQKRRAETEAERSKNALDMLNAQVIHQAQKVEDARQRMIELSEQFDIVNFGTGMPASAIAYSNQVVSKAEQEIFTIQSHINALRGLEWDTLTEEAIALLTDEATAFNVVDDTIVILFPVKRKLNAQIDAMRASGIGPRHPDLKMIEYQVGEVGRLVENGIQAVKHSLQKRLEISQKSLESLPTTEAEKNDAFMQERRGYTQYVEAKRAYETQSIILTDMRQALLKKKVRPATDPVEETKPPTANQARKLMGFPAGDEVLDFRARAILKFRLFTGARPATGWLQSRCRRLPLRRGRFHNPH